MTQNMSNNTTTPTSTTTVTTTTRNEYRFVSPNQWTDNFYYKWSQISIASKIIFSFSITVLVLQLTSISYVLYHSYDLICQDQEPFRLFLLVHGLRSMISCPLNIYLHFGYLEPFEYDQIDIPFNYTRAILRRFQLVLNIFSIFWFLFGNYLVFFYNSDTLSLCDDLTAAKLSYCIVIYGFIIIALPIVYSIFYYILLPCFLSLLQCLHVIPSNEKSGASLVDMSTLPIYQFHHSSNVLVSQPLKEKKRLPTLHIPQVQDQFCVICQSRYQDNQMICKLWCDHHFCKKCIFEWLKVNAKCPLCKRDCRRRASLAAPQDILPV